MSRVGRNVRVTGRVQGVFFRAWTAEQAGALGVGGWVRNAADGSVEAHLSGSEEAVVRLLGRLRKGPPAAHVDDVVVEAVEPEEGDRFEVRH